MKDILSAGSTIVLQQYGLSEVVVGLDFDGTLAPIVEDRRAATMRRTTRDRLRTLSKLYPCAVISGRARLDVEARLDGVALRAVIGNHGIEATAAEPRFAAETAETFRRLAPEVERLQGVSIEYKRYSLSVHYRQARAKSLTRDLIHAALARAAPAACVADGDCVVNVMPAGAPNKGDALRQFARAEGAQSAIFIGDDLTDEDAFALTDPPVLGIRVGHHPSSSAGYFVHDQLKVDDLLARLIAIRADR